MFTKPLSQAEYSDVEFFCNTFGEGVRVEYKSEMIKEIPKIISAFANTLGGIIVIGVETDKVQNRVIAVNGIDNKSGIEESIISSSLQGIYPSVIPEIKIIDIPEKKNKILVVIKVHESKDAPHAIQNSTRVYIRTGSVSQPYEFAEIDRIEYMLKRREKSTELKRDLIQDARLRIDTLLRVINGPREPYFYVAISPVFPYNPLISLDELYAFCSRVPYNSTEYLGVDNPQRIVDGICKFYGKSGDFSYREINHYGLVFACETLDKRPSRWKGGNDKADEKLYIVFAQFIFIIGRALKLAKLFYDKCTYLGNLEVGVSVKNVSGECLLYNEEGFPQFDKFQSVDSNSYSSEIITVEDIDSRLLDIVTSLTRNILWVFDCSITDSQQMVERVLVASNLIKK